MLSTGEIQAHLAEVTYMPGWSVRVYDGDFEGQHVAITARVEDAYAPGETTVLDVHSQLPPMPDVGYFDRWLLWRLGIIWSHENREWLKFAGAAIFDPHAEHANRDSTDYDPSPGGD